MIEKVRTACKTSGDCVLFKMRRKTIRTLKEANSGARSFVLYHEKKMLPRVYESCCSAAGNRLVVPADRRVSVACMLASAESFCKDSRTHGLV